MSLLAQKIKMTALQRENEQKIFDSIQDLKDSLFGLKNSYVEYCYSSYEEDYSWNEEKSLRFISEILAFSKNSRFYNDAFEKDIQLVLELAIKFIHLACPFDDRRFSGIRKIVKTLEKPTAQYKSVFEVMVEQQSSYLDEEFKQKCKILSQNITGIDFDSFYTSIKHGIEAFIDAKKLNTLHSKESTDEILYLIKKTTAISTLKMKNYAKSNGIYDYE